MQFLYEQLDGAKKIGMKWPEVPDFMVDNLNPDFELREYQKEAFARFFHCYNNPFEGKESPLHFLFNMATGSGKTLIMAGLILYLYEQGYSNFIFFVNSDNIIKKTEDNFLNTLSSKYLFNKKIVLNNKIIPVRKVDNFEDIGKNEINICFTTIQKLHSDLHNEKEGALTFEDFKDKKIVLLSDEAHHSQVKTRSNAPQADLFASNLTEEIDDKKPNWENTVEKILKKNGANLLLEFTATMDFLDKFISEKYKNKVIYKYDLKEFRNDGFSKDPQLFSTDTDKKTRIIQAIILNQYRQEVADKYKISLKPVILFKAQKTIAQSDENKKLFHEIIENLSIEEIKQIRSKTNIEILSKAFDFYKEHDITDLILIKKLKENFAENKCRSVNDETQIKQLQIELNTLEEKINKVRAIFAVQKLNEGWDVLNLFDIVRLYETRDGKDNKPGKTTISEAQLIGRGARYFPFKIDEGEKYKRKFDKNLDHELRILEELHYHSHNESRYIAEITTALIKEGMMDDNQIELELKLKESFKNKQFYKTGLVYKNERKKRSFDGINSISDLGVSKKNITFSIISGLGQETGVFTDKQILKSKIIKTPKDIKIKDIEFHIIQNALAKNDFFDFSNLKTYFPKLKSMRDFIADKNYFGGLAITFEGMQSDLDNMTNKIKLEALLELLCEIERQIKSNVTEYIGSKEFTPAKFRLIFKDKKIKVQKDSEKVNGGEENLADKEWYVFNANYGTSEEKELVNLIHRQVAELYKDFKEVYLVRNERQLKIYNFKDGATFEPDYLLFLTNKKGQNITYQLFIEPKGKHLAEYDKWKNDFLSQIKDTAKIIELNKNNKYRVLGLPFYNNEDENQFKDKLIEFTK
ncbi:MAG: hypothetical protein UU24_C0002G0013 [Candidatus Nomurabacteria bacterium GW2011_GWA2_40_9]|uniref:Helicase ATP-binding domain-containing protein n=1 Tax=Candidatus Nomurabacteria bacterium GW2011_GWA2_40_9 TaxID=1618734 RepID=A0A0G0WWJ8_9BACT|nr:MAG: hypothetical protein UU24_C0002G0013 [Candidatus Nomurabacteria bacterium GW2011_GWA2_40_9]